MNMYREGNCWVGEREFYIEKGEIFIELLPRGGCNLHHGIMHD